MQADRFTAETIMKMEEMEANPLAREQYLDFLKCRRFRQTLLCRQGIPLDRQIKAESMRDFNISSSAQTVSPETDIRSAQEEEFQSDKGERMKTGHPLTKAVMMHLGSVWPRSLSFEELLSGALRLLGKTPGKEDTPLLGKILENAFRVGFVELNFQAPRLSLHPGERPLASSVARIQAQRGEIVANLRHIPVRLEGEISRKILQMMDGTRDRAALAKELQSVLQQQEAIQHEKGMSNDGSAEIGIHEVEKILNDLARLALIVE
jgi:methyltransferase-like protein